MRNYPGVSWHHENKGSGCLNSDAALGNRYSKFRSVWGWSEDVDFNNSAIRLSAKAVMRPSFTLVMKSVRHWKHMNGPRRKMNLLPDMKKPSLSLNKTVVQPGLLGAW